MVELLVALAITIVLMLFVGQIFSQVSDAAKSGIAVSHILENARTVVEQISDDEQDMVGPSGGGFLIIQTGLSPNAPLNPDNESRVSQYFMDQVMWVRQRGDLEPLVPQHGTTYAGAATAYDAKHVRVYYGHARKTLGNGNDSGDFGAAGANRFANAWVMARHGLFLTDSASFAYAASAAPGASVTDPGSGYFTNFTAGNRLLKFGVADVANQTLAAINTAGPSPSTAGFGSTSADRLRVNPAPLPGNFEQWRIAQMTPILATGVSDIIVEYAADKDGSGAMDTTNGVATGPIRWYRESATFTTSSPYWPDLIRIRFRLHGPRGNLVGADGSPGVMYEKIVRVRK